jgi:hypothetical protein
MIVHLARFVERETKGTLFGRSNQRRRFSGTSCHGHKPHSTNPKSDWDIESSSLLVPNNLLQLLQTQKSVLPERYGFLLRYVVSLARSVKVPPLENLVCVFALFPSVMMWSGDTETKSVE